VERIAFTENGKISSSISHFTLANFAHPHFRILYISSPTPPSCYLLISVRVSLKDDGPTGQTTGQRGSDPSAYRVRITGYYNILQGIKPETTQKPWILLSSNAHLTKYSTRTATITVKLNIKHKEYHEYAKELYIFSTYLLPRQFEKRTHYEIQHKKYD